MLDKIIFFLKIAILDIIKWNSKPPSPSQVKDEAAQKRNRVISDPWFSGEGGGDKSPIHFVQDCRSKRLLRRRLRLNNWLCLFVCLFFFFKRTLKMRRLKWCCHQHVASKNGGTRVSKTLYCRIECKRELYRRFWDISLTCVASVSNRVIY